MVARAGQALAMKRSARPAADDQPLGPGNLAKGLAGPQGSGDRGGVRDQAPGQVAGFGAGIGDHLLALAVITAPAPPPASWMPTSRSASRTAAAGWAGRAATAAPGACPPPPLRAARRNLPPARRPPFAVTVGRRPHSPHCAQRVADGPELGRLVAARRGPGATQPVRPHQGRRPTLPGRDSVRACGGISEPATVFRAWVAIGSAV